MPELKEDFSNMHPGTRGEYDMSKRWTLENEIEWTENFIRRLERSLEHQDERLNAMYLQRLWWLRFLNYCNTPVWKYRCQKEKDDLPKSPLWMSFIRFLR